MEKQSIRIHVVIHEYACACMHLIYIYIYRFVYVLIWQNVDQSRYRLSNLHDAGVIKCTRPFVCIVVQACIICQAWPNRRAILQGSIIEIDSSRVMALHRSCEDVSMIYVNLRFSMAWCASEQVSSVQPARVGVKCTRPFI